MPGIAEIKLHKSNIIIFYLPKNKIGIKIEILKRHPYFTTCFEQKKSNWHTMCLLAGPPYFGVGKYVPYIASSRGTEGKHRNKGPSFCSARPLF